MRDNEQKADSIADQKNKIRERYKGVSIDELDVIPALPQEDIFAVENEQRVAVYARVSTDDPRQTSSYELQKNHYHDVISKSPNWKLVQIYADEGISGTSLQHRDQFKLMIEDCKKGEIDLIVTKSVSRFARNVVDCIGYVRELLALPHPVGVFFETERLNTFDPKSEMVLSFMATLAQNGVKVIETKDQPLDTDYHEAIAVIPAPSEEQKGKILDCVQTGYTLNDKVIRHAKVVVGE